MTTPHDDGLRRRSIADLLDEHPFCADLDARDRAILAGCGHNVAFASGRMIFREGDPANELYVLRRGRVAIEVHAPGGPIVIATVAAGDVFGISWIIPPYRRHLDARAIGPVGAVALDGGCLRQRCETDTALGYRLMQRFATELVERLRATRIQLLDVYGGDRARA